MSEFTVVMLAGWLRPSALSGALRRHVLSMPLTRETTLLDAWLEALDEIGAGEVRIVVNTDEDRRELLSLLEDRARFRRVSVIVEPASWRGSAGIVKDVTEDLEARVPVLVVEAGALPPTSLAPMASAFTEMTEAVIGATESHEPCGVFAFRRGVFSEVGSVGYHDMKEQVLPLLSRRRAVVKLALLGREVCRLRDRAGYLRGVALHAERQGVYEHPVERGARSSDAPHLLGVSVVCEGAVVKPGAVVQDSVILPGAVVESGAVICRSVLGPGATAARGERVIDAIVTVASERERPVPRRDRIGVRN